LCPPRQPKKLAMPSEILGVWPEPMKRFHTLHILAEVSYYAAALSRKLLRAVRDNDAGSDRSRTYGPAIGVDEAWDHYTWRVWWVPPALWRDEITWSNGERTVIIVQNNVALSYISMQSVLYTTDPAAAPTSGPASPAGGMHLPTIAERLREFPLSYPRLETSDWKLTALGQESHRAAWHIGCAQRTERAA
jgi:hypothetical protein